MPLDGTHEARSSTTDLPARPTSTIRATPRPGSGLGLTAAPRLDVRVQIGRLAFPAIFVAILLLGAAFRFTDLDWDQGQHLHPDERNVTQVLTALGWPSSFSEYLDEQHSPLNPRNVGYSFFAYGTLPTTIIKGVALALNRTGYEQVYLVGRAISALLDMGSLLLVFLLALRLYRDRRIALLAMFLLATSVLAIQHAHFMVVDPWACFFLLAATYFLVGVQQKGGLLSFLLVGLFFGLGMAAKLSIYTFVLVIALVGLARVWQAWQRGSKGRDLAVFAELTLMRLALAGLVSFAVFRLAQPDAFNGPGLLDMGLSARWLANLDEVSRLVSGAVDTPPGHQWTDRMALIFPWLNMVIWGMGVPLGLAAWAGWAAALWQMIRRRDIAQLVPVAWIGILFLHQGSQWVKSMRYLLPIYPLLALLAAWLLIKIWDRARIPATDRLSFAGLPATPTAWAALRERLRLDERAAALAPRLTLTTARAGALIALVAGGTLLWAVAFANIYTQDHTRVQATRWIYANVPTGVTLGVEYWDDPLPIRMDGKDPFGGLYSGLQLPWYDNDSPDKLKKALEWLDKTDYLILSSNRLYDSIPRLPTRYPMTIRYYQSLFDGSLGFNRVAEFTSYPQLLGVSISDQGAEEAFSVYDHPRVQIFQKTALYSRANSERILGAVDLSRVIALTPKQASSAPTGLLLPPALIDIYRQAGTWSQLFNAQSFSSASPVLAWALILQLLGLMAVPYLFVAAPGLPDRGYSLSKILGLLLPATLIWLLASLRLVEFSRQGILLAVFLFGVGGALIAYSRWAELRAFWRARRGLLLLQEGLFWGCFAAFLLIRAANPDLWHDVRGGEKPMDLAFLTAVIKSPFFPPYDPWFADGFINYYYFGFVPVAMLIKLAGIVPQIAYNLAISTLFALTALGAFGLALGLVGRRVRLRRRDIGFALLGTLFVTVCGNLAEVKLLGDGFANLAGGATQTAPLGYLGRVWDGFNRSLQGQALPIKADWWFWNASRVISHPPTEAGPINEFPFFTFLFSDLHAHALDLPFTLLVLGLALSLVRGARTVSWQVEALRLGLLALATGTLWAANTWDFPTYSAVVLAALLLREWKIAGRITFAGLRAAGWRILVVMAASYIIFMPFHRSYGSAYGSIELWGGSRTPLDEYLLMHGLFLFLIGAGMLADLLWGVGHNAIVRRLQLRLHHRRRLRRLLVLERELLRPAFWHILALRALAGGAVLVLALAALGFGTPALILIMLTLAGLLLFRRRPQPIWQLGLVFAALGLALTLLVEFAVLKGDIARLNTVFKFYFQVWTLFALASVLAAARVWEPTRRAVRAFRVGWSVGFALLLAGALLYPLLAAPARIADRMSPSNGLTLDGASFLRTANYSINGQQLSLDGDAQAINWLQENVAGSPVIAEANTYPTLYGWGNRFAMFTGLPAIVGWDFHERQQRGVVGSNMVTKRVADVQRLYATPDAAEAYALLRRYEAALLVVGALERSITPAEGIAKFAAGNGVYWDLVYDATGVQIYHVLNETTQ